jgi:murein L,D-transpeptidase YcbB/YkuD
MQGTALRSVSVTIEPIPYSTAMRKAEMAQTAEVAEELSRQRQGFMTTARIRRRQQAASRREEELADGHAQLRVGTFVTAYNATAELLERTKSEVEHGAQLSRLELQPLYGEQDAGFANTLPLCRGLR